MSEPFEIVEYSIERLLELLAKKSNASLNYVKRKLHSTYFKNYFGGIGAQTIVVENNYIDRDFLDDYAEYYVKCFKRYRRKCTRLHFFDSSFSSEQLKDILSSGLENPIALDLKRAYLGFIVVKPLPQTIIGRTCLKPYPRDGGRRCFPIVRSYEAHLFGIPLRIKSLAFQEQDTVVAACATSALWSIFHGTGMVFQHAIPSPVQITKTATDNFPIENRAIPSHGLNIAQMAIVIRNAGLEPLFVNVRNHYLLKKTLSAYLKGGIPLIMGMGLYDITGEKSHLMGKHAVAVTGFSLGSQEPFPLEPTGFLLKASRIDKVYVHDDQVGPFARMLFDGEKVSFGSQEFESLSTSWRGDNGNGPIGSARAIADFVLIPIYHKIRIPFGMVHDSVLNFDSFLEAMRNQGLLPSLEQRVEWDIYFTTVNELKTDLLSSMDIRTSSYRKKILLEEMPRFLWRAIAYHSNVPVLELIHDATDIEQGNFFLRAIEYDLSVSLVLHAIAKEDPLYQAIEGSPTINVLKWYRENELADAAS